MNLKIFHTVNAGLYLWDGETGILIDGIHEGQTEGLSPMPEMLKNQMYDMTGIFSLITGLLFTHLHPDHFDQKLYEDCLAANPNLVVYAPGLKGSIPTDMPENGVNQMVMGNAMIYGFRTIHDGERFARDAHQSYLIRMGENRQIFVAGDALLDVPDAETMLSYTVGAVTDGFFNLYQLASEKGQAFLDRLKPQRIYLYHMPFKEDDIFHYYQLARHALKTFPTRFPTPFLLHPMTQVSVNI